MVTDIRTQELIRRWKYTGDDHDLEMLGNHVERTRGVCLHRGLTVEEFDASTELSGDTHFGARVSCKTCKNAWWCRYKYPFVGGHSLQAISLWNPDGTSVIKLKVYETKPTSTGHSLHLHWEGECAPYESQDHGGVRG